MMFQVLQHLKTLVKKRTTETVSRNMN